MNTNSAFPMPLDGPLVSIIVPCYNAAMYVADAIRSVIAQTYPHWELLLIDDGSKDNTMEIANPFLQDLRIRLFRKNNQGVSAARNYGIMQARGEYIAFLDSDDIWEPEKLHRQLEIFNAYPDVGVCGSEYTAIDSEGNTQGSLSKSNDFCGNVSAALVSCILTIPLSSGIVRKEVCDYLQTGQGFFFDETISSLSEDFDFWLRLSALCRFYKIGEPLIKYRIWPGNTTSKIWRKRQDTVLNYIIPRFRAGKKQGGLVHRKHIRQLRSVFYHERGSCHPISWCAATYWFTRSLISNPLNRDAWGALGHQFLPNIIYRLLCPGKRCIITEK